MVIALGRAIAGIPITSGFEGLGQGITQIVFAIACGILAVLAGTFVTSRCSHQLAAIIGAAITGAAAVVVIVWWAPSLALTYLASTQAALIAIAAVAIAAAIGVALSSVRGAPINRRRLRALGVIIPLLFIVATIRTIGANYRSVAGRLSIIERSWEKANLTKKPKLTVPEKTICEEREFHRLGNPHYKCALTTWAPQHNPVDGVSTASQLLCVLGPDGFEARPAIQS